MVSGNLVLFLFCISGVFSALPDGWSACKQSSPGYEECLKKQIQNAFQFFKNGNSKMGVIPLEPLRFETMDVEQKSGAVSITLKMKKVMYDGLSNTQVNSVKNDWKKMFLKLFLPQLHQHGNYTVNGKIMSLPVSGTGTFDVDWEKLNYTLDITFKQITKNGKKYFQVDKMPVVLTPENIRVNFDNLFNGNKELGDNMNKFLNENWRVLLVEMMPAISKTLEAGYGLYINSILSQIPAEEIDIK